MARLGLTGHGLHARITCTPAVFERGTMNTVFACGFTTMATAALLNCGYRSQQPPGDAATGVPAVQHPRFAGGTWARCPSSECKVGQYCRSRSLVEPIGPVTYSPDGTCPTPSFAAECVNAPGRICCVMAVALLDILDLRCVDAPPNCKDCSCLPKDVCGPPAETVQICTHVQDREVTCGLPVGVPLAP